MVSRDVLGPFLSEERRSSQDCECREGEGGEGGADARERKEEGFEDIEKF